MPKRPSMQDRKPETARATSKTDAALMGQERTRREVVELLIREVMPNRQQPRTTFSDESMDELADSIRLHGVLEPIIVREIPLTAYEGHGRQYELIAGERRWRAALRAGISTIPALVLPASTTDQAALELAITENLQREDLHPLDEALAFGRMQRELGYSYAQIAERLGKSKGYVQNRTRLLQLDDDLQQLVAERPDTLTHVYELAKVSDLEQRRALIGAVRHDALSFAETRARVQAILAPAPVSAEGESYLHKYDSEEKHRLKGASEGPSAGESYLRRYDSEHIHNSESTNAELPSRAAVSPTTVGGRDAVPAPASRVRGHASLTSRERTVLAVATEKIERYLHDLSLLTEEDWAVLSPLSLRLSDLVRQVGRARDAARDTDSPDR